MRPARGRAGGRAAARALAQRRSCQRERPAPAARPQHVGAGEAERGDGERVVEVEVQQVSERRPERTEAIAGVAGSGEREHQEEEPERDPAQRDSPGEEGRGVERARAQLGAGGCEDGEQHAPQGRQRERDRRPGARGSARHAHRLDHLVAILEAGLRDLQLDARGVGEREQLVFARQRRAEPLARVLGHSARRSALDRRPRRARRELPGHLGQGVALFAHLAKLGRLILERVEHVGGRAHVGMRIGEERALLLEAHAARPPASGAAARASPASPCARPA